MDGELSSQLISELVQHRGYFEESNSFMPMAKHPGCTEVDGASTQNAPPRASWLYLSARS